MPTNNFTRIGRCPRILITAGATCEDLDSVRFITNRSTGRMGVALAESAKLRGWETRLLLSETAILSPSLSDTNSTKKNAVIRFRSAADLLAKVEQNFDWCDWLIMTAAVADYTPVSPRRQKIHKTAGGLTLKLKRTADILRKIAANPARPQKIICGFSLTDNLDIAEAQRKVREKKLDLIVANTVAAFGIADVRAVILSPKETRKFSSATKADLANEILAAMTEISAAKNFVTNRRTKTRKAK